MLSVGGEGKNHPPAMRAYYTKNVVERERQQGITVTHDFEDKAAAIPLPATMVHQMNVALTEKAGYTLHLYSAFPFPFRKGGGPRDAFEQEALQFLAAHPDDVSLENVALANSVPLASHRCPTCVPVSPEPL